MGLVRLDGGSSGECKSVCFATLRIFKVDAPFFLPFFLAGGKFANGAVAGAMAQMYNADSEKGVRKGKTYLNGEGFEDSFAAIMATPFGTEIIGAIQDSKGVLSVDILEWRGMLGKTTSSTILVNIGESGEFWEVWKESNRVKRTSIDIRINMNLNESLMAVDGSRFDPSLTRIMAHELGHAYNVVKTGRVNNSHRAIEIENKIMRQIDPSATVRHPSAEHSLRSL